MEQTGPQRSVVHERRSWRDRLVDGARDRKLLVLHLDREHRARGRRLVVGGDGGDGLTVEAHPVDRDDRPVPDRVAPVRIDVAEVAPGQDAGDSGHRLGARGVDRDDARVRDGTAQHLAEEHPRHGHVAHELGLATQLLAAVEPLHRASDLTGDGPGRALDAHVTGSEEAGTPASSQTASTMPL